MRKLIVPAATTALFALLVMPGIVQAKTKYADIRVVTSEGDTLADFRQYSDDVVAKASRDADCFGPSNPSSNKDYKLKDPNVLGTLIDASKSERDLKPLSLTDAFVDDGFGFGVCDIGGIPTDGFTYWYSSINGVGASTGPDLIPVENGDRHLWYRTNGSEPGFPNELVIDAPVRALTGSTVTATVTRVASDGTTEPAEGAVVQGALGPADAQGEVSVLVADDTDLVATGETDDAQSAVASICAAGDDLSNCPKARGIDIFGSNGEDTIKSAPGPDRIVCGKGKDVVKGAQRGEFGDKIANDCEKVKRK